MSEEVVYLEETEEQKEALDEVMAMIGIIASDFVDIDPDNPPINEPLTKLFRNNQENLGIVLAKLHLYFDLNITYDPYSEFEEFATFEDVFQYFGDKVLTKRGLW